MHPERKRIIGSLEVEGGEKKTKDLTAEDLLFRLEQMAEVKPQVRLWVERAQNMAEKNQRTRVAEQVLEDFNYLRDIATTDFGKRGANFADIARKTQFKERAKRLFRFLDGHGLSGELDKRMADMTVEVAREREPAEDFPLLPSRYYDPNIYTEHHTVLSVGMIEQDVEAILNER